MELLEHLEFSMYFEKLMYLKQPASVADDVSDENNYFILGILIPQSRSVL